MALPAPLHRAAAVLLQHDEDKYFCIILNSQGGVFDTIPVPSVLEDGGASPQALWLHSALWKARRTLTLYN